MKDLEADHRSDSYLFIDKPKTKLRGSFFLFLLCPPEQQLLRSGNNVVTNSPTQLSLFTPPRPPSPRSPHRFSAASRWARLGRKEEGSGGQDKKKLAKSVLLSSFVFTLAASFGIGEVYK